MGLFGNNNVVYRESDALSQIDGILVTDGSQIRVTMRARLSMRDKEQGKAALLRQMRASGQPGVYMWNADDNIAYYSGADGGRW